VGSTSNAKVTVGIPVYNGEKFIRQAIDSVLSQTYNNFELIISDNASTDSTPSICRDYEKKDSRIRYIKHDINRGATFNFPFTLSEAKSDYFVWLAYDDYWEPTFLEKNVAVLESNENVVGSIGLVEFYGVENWHIKKNLTFKIKNAIRRGSNEEHEKYVHVRPAFGVYEKKAGMYLRFNQGSFTYGLFRTEKLRKRLVPVNMIAWDLVLILNVLKEGDLYVIDEVLLHRFVSGVHSRSGHFDLYKKNIIPLTELILPFSSVSWWCMKNIGMKFVLKNSYWFMLLVPYCWVVIIRDVMSGK